MFKCDICGSLTKNINEHKYNKHGITQSGRPKGYRKKDQQLPCGVCEVVCRNPASLLEHRMAVHKLSKFVSKCTKCGLLAMASHITACDGENVAMCRLCKLAINTKGEAIYRHLKRQHGMKGKITSSVKDKVSVIDKDTGKRLYIDHTKEIMYVVDGWRYKYSIRKWKKFARRLKTLSIRTEADRRLTGAVVLFKHDYLTKW